MSPYDPRLDPTVNRRLLRDLAVAPDVDVLERFYLQALERYASAYRLRLRRTPELFDPNAIATLDGDLRAIAGNREWLDYAAAFYRFFCGVGTIRVLADADAAVSRELFEYQTEAAAFRICFALGQALLISGFNMGRWTPFERVLYQEALPILVQGRNVGLYEVSAAFLRIFLRGTSMLDVPPEFDDI